MARVVFGKCKYSQVSKTNDVYAGEDHCGCHEGSLNNDRSLAGSNDCSPAVTGAAIGRTRPAMIQPLWLARAGHMTMRPALVRQQDGDLPELGKNCHLLSVHQEAAFSLKFFF